MPVRAILAGISLIHREFILDSSPSAVIDLCKDASWGLTNIAITVPPK
jgi:hypothetical protein